MVKTLNNTGLSSTLPNIMGGKGKIIPSHEALEWQILVIMMSYMMIISGRLCHIM